MVSTEVRLNECISKLEKANAYSTFRDRRLAAFKEAGKPLPITKTLELAESVLETATRTITKHNGAEFRESGWSEYREGSMNESADNGDPRVAQVKGYMLTCNISESEARQVLDLPPAGLTRKQSAEFSMAVSCGIPRAEAERLAKQN